MTVMDGTGSGGEQANCLCVGVFGRRLGHLRVDDPHASLQAALECALPPAAGQNLSFHHQVLGA